MNHIPMTLNGAKKLREELKYLKQIRRPEIIKAIAEARQYGDLKENAEYHSAKEQQYFCEGRIQEIEAKLINSNIIDIKKIPVQDRVVFGVTISIKNLHTSEKKTYKIVGDDEADFKYNLISVNSPLARSLIGKKTLDIVDVYTPRGITTYKILDIKYL
ncbi:transcription elongation factor [Wigglesworthia glossinidia endosymbiont of Glossina morsitans morsitans (Yale colony)]|uniref:Transcription elongation factor GreA n=1 Tax=Wigglesworthia glossinidia endosymbiont of Glossina morsitans morsitans (Yale colony) TaxID=1142511 RepID=H6Q584_WIGGL|nr:transcription elongation factor GreA [Wigglesworthia glossinidia]AFA41367.1 transcription elongation factor [Wigglesworthia glossinidia endosymbiont of Glossina morsitans morsitans (Yale colony)]